MAGTPALPVPLAAVVAVVRLFRLDLRRHAKMGDASDRKVKVSVVASCRGDCGGGGDAYVPFLLCSRYHKKSRGS